MNVFTRTRQKLGRWLLRSSSGATMGIISSPCRATSWRASKDPLSISAVLRCVNLISSAVASMPLRHLKERDGVMTPYTASSLYYLLTVQPNAQNSAFEFWRMVVRHMITKGAVFIYQKRADTSAAADTQPLELYAIPATYVTVYRERRCYDINDTEQRIKAYGVPESEIIFLRGLSPDGFYGESILDHSARSCQLSEAADDEALNRIENGGSPRYFVQSESGLMGTGEAVEGTLDTFLSRLDIDLGNDGKQAIYLPDGMKAIPAGSTAADMQFQGMREFAVREICRFFGVPPTFVFSEGASNYKTTEAAQLDFLQNTLDPILRNIENELQRKLIRPSKWGTERFEFDRASRMSIDSESRARYYSQMLGVGLTVNEIRKQQNMPPVEGGDSPCVSANLRFLSELNNTINNNNNARPESNGRTSDGEA